MPSLLGNDRQGLVFIVSAPAGTGKTTLVRKLIQEFPSIIPSVSFTTRQPRHGEKEGVDYHFISEIEFEEKIAAADFLEYVKLYDTYYGTSKQWIEGHLKQGRDVILVIDTQGALQLKEKMSAISIFITPPSIEILKKRLFARQTENLETIEKRIQWAPQELEAAKQYDYQLVNDELDIAYQVFKSIFIAESHRIRPNLKFKNR